MPRRRGQLPDEPPEFFAERSLGGRIVAELLRADGWNCVGWLAVYPDPTDADLADEVWIPNIVASGCNILTTDDAMRRSPIITTTIENNEAHVFALTSASLTAEEAAARYLRHQDSIWRYTTLPGPVYCTVASDRVTRKF
jgi:hypothetical protein